MAAEERLDEIRLRRGVSEEAVADALRIDEPDERRGSRAAPEDEVYLSALARYVAALGGHLELRAVFPGETVTLLNEPERPGKKGGDSGSPEAQ
ncbi:MAG: hypothetical protein M3Z06_04810 [Actinomycetota bacterium]|nr:hypothetical protein [Actinomycetota bacterium]